MSANKDIEDRILLVGLRNGDEEAFKLLFNKYAKRLFGIARQYLNDDKESEEIVQEVFYKIWLHRGDIQPERSFVSYIARIAKNIIINQTRRRLVKQAYLDSFGTPQTQNMSQTERHVIFNEIRTIVEEIVNGLPPKRKEIFMLSRYEGRTTKEIAQQLRISERTVEGQINKALKTLRKQLKSHGY